MKPIDRPMKGRLPTTSQNSQPQTQTGLAFVWLLQTAKFLKLEIVISYLPFSRFLKPLSLGWP